MQDQSNQPKNLPPVEKKVAKKKKLPVGVRCVVYSYFEFEYLANQISKVSKNDRK